MARNAAAPAPASDLLANPHSLLIRTSLTLAFVLGFSLGLYLIVGFAFQLPVATSAPALMQVHGQVQALGFVALFIIAVGAQIIPRFHASTLLRPRQVSIGGLLVALGLVLRAFAQPVLPPAPFRGPLLLLSALLELVGALLAMLAFAQVIRRSVQSEPRGFGLLLPITLAGSLVSSLLLNVLACIDLATGSLVVPFNGDEALLHFELWGFASTMVLAVSGRIFPRFLLLQPTREKLVPLALVLWAVGSFGVPLVWAGLSGSALPRAAAALAQLLGALLYVVALRLYDTPVRPSGMPHVTDPTRLWARVAYLLMILAAAADFGLALADALHFTPAGTSLSAARHALAQGFLLPVIVVMAARILPGYSGYMLHRGQRLAWMVWTLFAGAALRFVAELLGGYAPGFGVLVAVGGTLAVIAFCVFAFDLWRTTGRVPRLAQSM